MRPIELDLSPAAFDADGIASASDSSGLTVALDGVLVSGGVFTSSDGLARIISITDTATSDQSGVDFTVTGTDHNGDAIYDTIVGPASGATVVTTKAFKTVTSVTINGAQGGSETVNIGTVNTTSSALSAVIPIDFYADDPPQIAVDISGTINYTVQQTFDNALSVKDSSGGLTWIDITALAAKTADLHSQCSIGARALRFKINSYTNGATMKVDIIQSA